MALCEKFKCKQFARCRFRSDGCFKGCLVARDIYKCSSCVNREKCKGTALYERMEKEKKYYLKLKGE